jgi:hypothetical protein
MTNQWTEIYDLMSQTLKAIDGINDESDLGVYSDRVGQIMLAYHREEAEIQERYK